MKNPKELFESIVNLSKKVLGENDVVENVVLADEVVEKKEVKEEVETKEAVAPIDEAVVAPVAQPAAVSKSEFDSAIAEIKEMYAKVLESISPSQSQEVPEALSAVVTEDVVTEEVLLDEEVVSEEVVVSETPTEEVIEEVIEEEVQVINNEEKVADGLVHDPEAFIEKKETFLYSQNRIATTQDAVFSSLFNNKN
jgi:hypothetical protein